jgi:peptidoglycan/LPS O-acetylase OafA/YrhL
MQPQFDNSYRLDIDGLRGVAIAFGVLYHFFPDFLPGSFIGVDIFFTLSGYLIALNLLKSADQNRFSIIKFYQNRFLRILPIFLAVTMTFLFVAWFVFSAEELILISKNIMSGGVFFANYFSWSQGGYFDVASEFKPFLHLWSLSLEEQFYFTLPLLFAVFINVDRSNFRKIILILLTISGIASFIYALLLMEKNATYSFFSFESRAWQFIAGCIAAFYSKHTDPQRLSAWYASFGLLILILGSLLLSKELAVPGYFALVPTIGSLLLIQNNTSKRGLHSVLKCPPVFYLGRISYSLFLWHWPIYVFYRIVFGSPVGVFEKLALIGLSIVLSILSYHFLEMPIRYSKNKAKPYLAYLLVFLIASLLICFLTIHFKGFPLRPIAQKFSTLEFARDELNRLSCPPRFSGKGNAYCKAMYPEKPISMAIVGDSHAEDKFLGIKSIDKSRNWLLLGHVSCPPVKGIEVKTIIDNCELMNQKMLELLINDRSIQTVVLSFFGNYVLPDAYAADHVNDPNKLFEKFEVFEKNVAVQESREDLILKGLGNFIRTLIDAKKSVVLVVDVPELPYLPKDCLRSFQRDECTVPVAEVFERQSKIRSIYAKLETEFPAVSIFDPTNLFCNKDYCIFKQGEISLYRDSNHLSTAGSNLFSEMFLNWLKANENSRNTDDKSD